MPIPKSEGPVHGHAVAASGWDVVQPRGGVWEASVSAGGASSLTLAVRLLSVLLMLALQR